MPFTTSQAETILNDTIPDNVGMGNITAYAEKVAERFHQYCAKPNWGNPEDEGTMEAQQRLVKYVKKCMAVTSPSVSDDPATALKEYRAKVARRLAKFFEEKILQDEMLN